MSSRSRGHLTLLGSPSPSQSAVEQEFIEGREYLFALIKQYTECIPQAFSEVGRQLLMPQLADVRITPGQVGQLDSWLKLHNGMRRMDVQDMQACRARLEMYLDERPVQPGSPRDHFEEFLIAHGAVSCGEYETLLGFYLRVLELTKSSSRTTSPPALRLVK